MIRIATKKQSVNFYNKDFRNFAISLESTTVAQHTVTTPQHPTTHAVLNQRNSYTEISDPHTLFFG